MKNAIQHFETSAEFQSDQAHWNLACIYQSERGYLDDNRALYHFRLAADFGNQEAIGKVGDYIVSVSGPRNLCFTNAELQLFLRKIQSLYSRRKNYTSNILAPNGFSATETLYCPRYGFGQSRAEISYAEPTVMEDPSSQHEQSRDIPVSPATRNTSRLELLSQRCLNWRMLPLYFVISLFFNLLMGILFSYFFYG